MKAPPVGPMPVLFILLSLVPAAALSQTGSISGTVRVAGSAPIPRMLKVNKNMDVCGDSLRASDVVVKDGRVAYAVASVEGLTEPPKPTQRLLSNTRCHFDPPVLVAAVGDTLVVDNQDDILHNTHLNFQMGERTRTVGNFALPGKGATVNATLPFRMAGSIEVECDAHAFMHGRMRVFAHPYYATTNQSGAFEIAGVPAGTHTVKVWHEVFGELEQTVTVKAGAATPVSFTFPAGKAGAGE